ELDLRAAELDERELELAQRGTEIEALRSRVEETLSVVEREQQLLSDREAALLNREQELDQREQARAEAEAAPAPSHRETSALVLGDGRYRLVMRDDGPPVVGSEIVVDDTAYRIVRLGPSPLPGDRRRCAFAELVAYPSALVTLPLTPP